ncbi:hypothetical protein B0T21DRAFT_370010 [Apiosordaria backusii]|uniref:Uncharacterized protein n=1 Tax=Apiosordaria backusii TaxID=314023 RepID=A0AA40B773_9PEZI|nr:hypothetical protein B0T21DRAFT_370010 [Apiosordaria backusii]
MSFIAISIFFSTVHCIVESVVRLQVASIGRLRRLALITYTLIGAVVPTLWTRKSFAAKASHVCLRTSTLTH